MATLTLEFSHFVHCKIAESCLAILFMCMRAFCLTTHGTRGIQTRLFILILSEISSTDLFGF